jgi:hypothetical protein
MIHYVIETTESRLAEQSPPVTLTLAGDTLISLVDDGGKGAVPAVDTVGKEGVDSPVALTSFLNQRVIDLIEGRQPPMVFSANSVATQAYCYRCFTYH